MKYFIEDTTLNDIADAIREKENSTEPIQCVDMAQRIINIPKCEHRLKEYAGTIEETVVGSGAYAVLATDVFLTEHRNDENLFIRVEFDIEPVPYTIVKNWGRNNVDLMPADSTTERQTIQRWDASGLKSIGTNNLSLNVTNPSGVGCMCITQDGELRVYSNSANYAIRPGSYNVKVEW